MVEEGVENWGYGGEAVLCLFATNQIIFMAEKEELISRRCLSKYVSLLDPIDQLYNQNSSV